MWLLLQHVAIAVAISLFKDNDGDYATCTHINYRYISVCWMHNRKMNLRCIERARRTTTVYLKWLIRCIGSNCECIVTWFIVHCASRIKCMSVCCSFWWLSVRLLDILDIWICFMWCDFLHMEIWPFVETITTTAIDYTSRAGYTLFDAMQRSLFFQYFYFLFLI